MPSTWTRAIAVASGATHTAVALASIGFGIAKVLTKLTFSTARSVTSAAPIPLLNATLTHLESLSLLPIILGESIASISLVAASSSVDIVSNLFEAEDEVSVSLATLVSLVRNQWAEHEAAGQRLSDVASAVAAWVAVQGITKQWSEERWLKNVQELLPKDFQPPEKKAQRTGMRADRSHRTISRVSVTEDVIMLGHSGQVVSADIGEKEEINDESTVDSVNDSSYRSNRETRKRLRRLSKIVLAGYGGAGLLFFGAPLRPKDPVPASSESSSTAGSHRTDAEVKDTEERILVHAVEDAEAEAMSPPMQNAVLPGLAEPTTNQRLSSHSSTSKAVEPNSELRPSVASSAYSWWNVLLGKHDREIFEGFAFTQIDESDKTPSPSTSTHSPSFSPQTRNRIGSSVPNSLHTDMPAPSRQDNPRKRRAQRPPTAMVGDLSKMPRFWVLTDHGRRQVVLVLRAAPRSTSGTMSYYELAMDLHCVPEAFEPITVTSKPKRKPQSAQSKKEMDDFPIPELGTTHGSSIRFPAMEDDIIRMPGTFQTKSPQAVHTNPLRSGVRPGKTIFEVAVEPSSPWPPSNEHTDDEDEPAYQVHSGILRLARTMGSPGKPVHEAVCAALARNRGYELVICGHSLGAGIAALFALMWADPVTCRTVPSSGLPSKRLVSVYCFAPPCIVSPALSRLCKDLIVSIVNSFDVVSRLSLRSARNLFKAAYWLCEGEGEENASSVLCRALKGKLNFLGANPSNTEEEEKWFIAIRKTLEANMDNAHLFPPGRVWWAVRDEALHPSHQRGEDCRNGIRLFEVLDVEHVFQQIEFKGDMLSSHLPHQYDRILSELSI